jgi:CDGSH-type Zn-finger protein
MADNEKKIEIDFNGPYLVSGGIPLVRKTQVVSEYGEPLTWKKEEVIPAGEEYRLCRCGQSQDKPFCDSTHLEKDFDGTECAETNLTAERQVTHAGTGIVVKKDPHVCMESGFCANRVTRIEKLVTETGDTQLRSLVIAMAERCPSGSLTYTYAAGEANIEPDLPQQIAVTTEITDEGPIPGPLWVTGNIPIERSDGQPMETRNRVTLCCCGLSKIKPLCDGTHRAAEVEKLKKKA